VDMPTRLKKHSMKQVSAFILIISLAMVALAQEITVFNHNYPYEYYYTCNSMQIKNDTFLLSGAIKYDNQECGQWLQGQHVASINSQGELVEVNSFSRCNWGLYTGKGGFTLSSENDYVFAGQEFSEISPENNLFFLKLNEFGDTILLNRYYEDTLAKRCWSMNKTQDNGYILVGSIDSTRSEYYSPDIVRGQIMLTKLNSLGEQIWNNSYIIINDVGLGTWQSGRNVIETWDKGYIVSGLAYNFSTYLFSSFIMKVDSLGNYKWKQFFSAAPYDAPNIMDIIATKDSCYVICGAKNYGEVFGGLYPYDGWIYKFDTNGMSKWQKTYREHHPEPQDYRDTIYCYFYSMCELPDGRIAVTGRARKKVGPSNTTPFLYLLTSEGDSIFSKHFCQYPENHPDWVNEAYPSKIVQTDNGGFAIAGWGVYTEWIEEEQHWEQPERIFLIKTDSLGNDIYTSISPPLQSPEDKFTVYPNPAAGWVTVTAPAEGVLELYGSTGSVALKANVSKGEKRIALTGLMPGMYLARLKNTGFTAKIIVQ